MNGQKKTLANQLITLVLPKLKGLSEKNAKKVLATVEKASGDIAKKYVKLVQEQEKEAAKAKAKADRLKKKVAEKEAKKKEKLAKKAAEMKQVAQLMAKEATPAPVKSVTKSAAKPKVKVVKK